MPRSRSSRSSRSDSIRVQASRIMPGDTYAMAGEGDATVLNATTYGSTTVIVLSTSAGDIRVRTCDASTRVLLSGSQSVNTNRRGYSNAFDCSSVLV